MWTGCRPCKARSTHCASAAWEMAQHSMLSIRSSCLCCNIPFSTAMPQGQIGSEPPLPGWSSLRRES